MKKLFHLIKRIRRAKKIARNRRMIPPYLKGDFTIELNYKLWITKGARFGASERTRIISELSSKTIGFLSAYLIIINLLNVYDIGFYSKLPSDLLGFVTTALSILILIYSQFESAKNYNVLSEKHHQCANEISVLYNQLRSIKTFSQYENILSKEKAIISITEEYERILRIHPNHEQIDIDYFKTLKPDYFNLSIIQIYILRIKRYFLSYFKYHLFIYGPIVLIISYQLIKQ